MSTTYLTSPSTKANGKPRDRRQKTKAHTINRSLEFYSVSELQKQFGYPIDLWPLAAVAELIDNALDHCEAVGVAPVINVTITDKSITVADNGSGMPPDVVTKLTDPDVRVSSNVLSRGPSRGKQGNASKCLIALPCVTNGGGVIIEAQEVRHVIRATVDEVEQRPVVSHREEQSDKDGTTFTVELPTDNDDFERLICDYAALNPHAAFRLDNRGDVTEYKARRDRFKKWNPRKPEPPQWYDLSSFKDLLAAAIKDGSRRSLATVVKKFRGLAKHSSHSRAIAEAGLENARLSDFVTADNTIDKKKSQLLLRTMQKFGKPVSPNDLGSIGRTAAIEFLEDLGCEAVIYRKTSIEGNIPCIVEAAYGEWGSEFEVISGLNFSASVDRHDDRI